MRSLLYVAGFLFMLAAASGHAQDNAPSGLGVEQSESASPVWDFALTAYWNDLRDGDSYSSGVFTADYEALHLEARSNYEAMDSRSVFVGWTFSGGETFKYDFTPIIGVVSGSKEGVIAGFEADISYEKFDYYIEAEYVHDTDIHEENFIYAWSELGYRSVQWLRAGIVAQRTRLYGEGREIQRGGFAQLTLGQFTLSAYGFNLGASDQIAILSLGASF